MGMSIDEHISQLKKLKSFHNGSYGANINFALDIMQKYRKIEEILNAWKYDGYKENQEKGTLWSIVSEVEDGNK